MSGNARLQRELKLACPVSDKHAAVLILTCHSHNGAGGQVCVSRPDPTLSPGFHVCAAKRAISSRDGYQIYTACGQESPCFCQALLPWACFYPSGRPYYPADRAHLHVMRVWDLSNGDLTDKRATFDGGEVNIQLRQVRLKFAGMRWRRTVSGVGLTDICDDAETHLAGWVFVRLVRNWTWVSVFKARPRLLFLQPVL